MYSRRRYKGTVAFFSRNLSSRRAHGIQASRMPTLNVTLNNIEAHPKTAKTEPKHQPEQPKAPRTHPEWLGSGCKIFFLHSTYISSSDLKMKHHASHHHNITHQTASNKSSKHPEPKLQPDTSSDWEPRAKHLDRSLDAYTPAPSTPSSMGALVP